MKVKALKCFNDAKEKKTRYAGEVFEVSIERYEQIHTSTNGMLVEVVEEQQEEDDPVQNKSDGTGEPNPKAENQIDYASMTKVQLLEHALKNGKKVNDKMKKEDIIKIIKGE